MKKNYLKKAMLLGFSILLASNYLWAFDGTGNIVSGGLTRTFRFHAPGSSVGANLPMMLVFHGDGGTGAIIEGLTGFNTSADANNFLVVYPDGLSDGSQTTWNAYIDGVPGNAGSGDPNAPDDVQFVSDLIDYFCANYDINPDKVYASGHSSGGFMCYNLAVQLPGKIAAIAPVSAGLWYDNAFLTNYQTNSFVAIPIYHIHGDADGTVEYPDPDFTPVGWGEYTLCAFSYYTCGTDTYTSTTAIVAGINKHTFCGPPGKEIYLIQVVGMDHIWPPIVAGYNPDDEIWNFCNAYSIVTGAACATSVIDEQNKGFEFSVTPNPSNGKFIVQIENTENQSTDGELGVFNVLGEKVFSTSGFKTINDIDLSDKPDGIYFIKVQGGNGISTAKIIIQK